MSEFLAEAQVLIRPNTAGFRAALIAELAAATAGIVVPVSVVPVGGGSRAARSVKTVSAAQKELAVATTAANAAGVEQVNVQQLGAAAATRDSIAQKKDAIATAENAKAHEQLARGAGATGLNLLGVRGATLAASAPFLVGAAAVTILAKAVKEATNEQEALARVERVLGPASKQLEEDAKGLATSFGLSAAEALRFEGSIANVLDNAKISRTEIPKMSEDLVKLAADMSAFNNVPIEGVLKTLQLSILGNTRGIKALGVELGAADVNQRALTLSGKENTHQLNQQDRILARLSLLYERTKNQQGAFRDRSHDLAGETRILTASLANLGNSIGTLVVPALTDLAQGAGTLVSDLNRLIDAAKRQAPASETAAHKMTLWGKAMHELHIALFILPAALSLLAGKEKEATDQTGLLAFALGPLKARLLEITTAFNAAQAASRQMTFREAIQSVAVLDDKLLDLQFKGASPEKILANLRKKVAAEQAVIASALTVKDKTAAKIERNQAQDQINSIIAKQKSDAKTLADNAVQTAQAIQRIIDDAANTVKQLIADAQQKLLDSFAVDQAKLNLRQTRAEGTKSLADNLAVLHARESLFQRQIVAAKKAKLDALTILGLEISLAETRNQITATVAAQAQNAKDVAAANTARTTESLDLDIQFAQIHKNSSEEEKAHLAKIKFLTVLQNHTKRGTNEWKRLRNEIANENEAVAALRKERGKLANQFKQMSFEFLQTQQGFAANLISNLIPHGATAGLVGGGGISTPTLPEPSRSTSAVGAGLSAAAQTSAGPQGASSGQMAALIHVNRQMLKVLERLSGQRSHPEAAVQKAATAAAMDIIPW